MSESKPEIKVTQNDADNEASRREALKKIAKFSAYTAPALLASVSGKSNAQPVS